MRYVFGFVFFLLAIGTLRLVGCGDDPCDGIRCDDYNECTRDECVDGVCESTPVEDGALCDDDDNECTVELCASGVCESTPAEDGTPCDDNGNECTVELCAGGACESTPAEDGTPCRNDGNECTVHVCAGGVCKGTRVEDGTACRDDGNECTAANVCASGACEGTPVEDGTPCDDDGNECTVEMCATGVCASLLVEDEEPCAAGAGACQRGICSIVQGTFSCSERGIRDAVAEGGGPFTFDCDGPATVTTEGEILIRNDVILDGEGRLTVHANDSHRVFNLPRAVTATLSGMTITGGYIEDGNGGGISSGGTLTLLHSTISENTARNSSGLERGHGGGIYNTGRLTLNKSTMSGNHAIPYCSFFGCRGGAGRDIANEGGTVALVDSAAGVFSWDRGTDTQLDSAMSRIGDER